MERKCIYKIFVLMLCALLFFTCSGCGLISVKEGDIHPADMPESGDKESAVKGTIKTDIPPKSSSTDSVSTTKDGQSAKTTNTTSRSSAATNKTNSSTANISEIAIRVIDKNDVPISNLRVSIRHLTGDKYNYTPDLAFTDAGGTVYGRADVKTYELTIEDVEGDVVFNKITSILEVEKGRQEYVVSWPHESPTNRKQRMKDTAVFRIKVGEAPLSNAHIELYVGHFETYERWTTTRPEVIDLGYSNENGEIIWGDPSPGKYTLYTYVTEEGEERKVSKQITITSIPYADSIFLKRK